MVAPATTPQSHVPVHSHTAKNVTIRTREGEKEIHPAGRNHSGN